MHTVLMHLLEHGFVITTITEAGIAAGYNLTKIGRL